MARVVRVYSMWLLNKPLLLCVESVEGEKWHLNLTRISFKDTFEIAIFYTEILTSATFQDN